ncbi:MAG TPA: cation diffusion facilitator family transporter [Actinomycetes bacterium]
MSQEGGSKRAILAAFLANLGIAVLKFVGFLITGAASMLAESIHSLADTGNQGLLILGGRGSRRAPTPEHPFGFGQERYFAAFLVAVVLFTLGSLFALFEGAEKLLQPHELENPPVAIAILLGAIALESWSLRTAAMEALKIRGNRSWWTFIRRTKNPELPVVLLEDFGALIGLTFALVGIGLAVLTGNPRFDALGSVAIGLLLGAIAILVGTEMRSLLIGEAASGLVVTAIREGLEGTEGVRRLIHLRTLHLGPEELLVAAKVELEPSFSFAQVAETIDRAEARVRDAVPSAHVIYLEPDVYRPEVATAPPEEAGADR